MENIQLSSDDCKEATFLWIKYKRPDLYHKAVTIQGQFHWDLREGQPSVSVKIFETHEELETYRSQKEEERYQAEQNRKKGYWMCGLGIVAFLIGLAMITYGMTHD